MSDASDTPPENDTSSLTKSEGISAGGAAFISLLVSVALASGAFAFRDVWLPLLNQSASNQHSMQIGDTPLPGFVPIPAATDYPGLQSLEDRVNALQDQLTQLRLQPITGNMDEQSALTLAALTEQVQNLQQQLSALEARPMPQPAPAAPQQDVRALVAFQALQAQALSGQPFAEALQNFVALLPDVTRSESAIASLREVAPTGRPTLAKLQAGFEDAIEKLEDTQAAQQQKSAASFTDKVLDNLSGFVRIRRVDGGGDAWQQAVAKAETALKSGDVTGALAAIDAMEDGRSAALGAWQAQARNFVELPNWLQSLQLAAVSAGVKE